MFLPVLWAGDVPAPAGEQTFFDALDPPPEPIYLDAPNDFSGTSATGSETVWHKDVNSGCSFSDHDIVLDIDAPPAEIEDASIVMTNYDVDYNDPQGCSGGPEVDYLYVNGNRIGQLKGANNSWSTNTFDLLSSYLVEGSNQIHVDTDAPGTGCWCVGVGFVEIRGKVGFKVKSHKPAADEKNVPWASPEIEVEFTRDYDSASLTSNILLEYRDQGGAWLAVPTTITSPAARIAKIAPTSDLKDGIRYRMTVKTGVKASDGTTPLEAQEQWYFWTMVNLDGQTAAAYPPNTTKDKMQITWFNVSRNKDLIKNKRVLNRIYAIWEPKSDVYDSDELTEFNAKVEFDYNGTKETQNAVLKRVDKYSANEKKNAQNTVNFYHAGGTANQEVYTLNLEPVPQSASTPKKFTKTATASVKANAAANIEFDSWACEMAGWYGGTVAAELTAAKNTLTGGATFTQEIFPVTSVAQTDKGTISRDASGFNMQYTTTKSSAWWFGRNTRFVKSPPTAATEIEEILHVMTHLSGLKGTKRFIAGLVPDDALPGANGVSWNHVVLFSESNFNEGTVAHEIGHEYTLNHNDSNATIEGFRVDSRRNKSVTEGNGEFASITPLMHTVGHPTNERWIRPDQYQILMGQLVPASSTTLQPMAVTGDYYMIMGYLSDTGGIESVLPLYRVPQPYLPGPTGTGYTLTMHDGPNGTGALLGSFSFSQDSMTITEPSGNMVSMPSRMFAFTIPYDNAVASLVITGPVDSLTLNKADFGAAAPTVAFTSPHDGDTIGGVVNVAWTGSDDSGTVYYRLEYSADGIDWTPVSAQMENLNSFALNTLPLLPGPDEKLALIAYDGFSSVRQEIAITLDNDVVVTRTVPMDGDLDVGTGQILTAYLANDLDPSTVTTDTFKLFQGSTPISGEVSYNVSGRQAIFAPYDELTAETTYTARLTGGAGGVTDVDGKTLPADWSWSFTTGAISANPQVDMVSPSHGSTAVPLNALVQATFERPLDVASVSDTTFLVEEEGGNPVSGTVRYDATTQSAVFVPSADLLPNTTYVATLTVEIADPQGLKLEMPYVWSFTTGTELSPGVRITSVAGDRGVDVDGDGLYDRLVLKVLIETLSGATYNINGQLADSAGEDMAWSSATPSFSAAGVYSVELSYPGSVIAAHGVDGPYLVRSLTAYRTNNASIYDVLREDYRTYAYTASAFYAPLKLSGIPDVAVALDQSLADALEIPSFASHDVYDVSTLDYSILINSKPAAGVSLDTTNRIDIAPDSGFLGTTEILMEAQDQDGLRALDTFRVSVLKALDFPTAAWYLISLPVVPDDVAIDSVLASIAPNVQAVWAYVDGAWRLYDPAFPGFSDLTTMTAGVGYWVQLNDADKLMALGAPGEGQDVTLHPGWNLVGLNTYRTIPVEEAMSSVAGRYLSVWAFIDGQWLFYAPDNVALSNLTELLPGYGYWLNVLVDTVWRLPE